MKTLLFSPMWLDKDNRFERNVKWINYIYKNNIMEKIGADELFFVDNASNLSNINALKYLFPNINIHRCEDHLERTSHLEYPYWYRAFKIVAQYAKDNGFQKIIHVDTDVYILRNRLCEYIKSIKYGWNCLWCPMHNFPESTFQVIGPDKINDLYTWMSEGYKAHYPCDAEHVIPWTNVIKDFTGDRYGEKHIPQRLEMDFYAQCPNEIKITFERKVGTESIKTYTEKYNNGFFDKYMSGKGCEIGYQGYFGEAQPILEDCDGYDINTPGYDGKNIPVPDGHYNWLYSSHTLEHIEDYKAAIKEWIRVVRPGGYIITVVPHRDLYENKLELPSQFNGDHKRFYTSASLVKEFEDALTINSFRVRHLRDNDEGHDYRGKVPCWLYEIEMVIQKL